MAADVASGLRLTTYIERIGRSWLVAGRWLLVVLQDERDELVVADEPQLPTGPFKMAGADRLLGVVPASSSVGRRLGLPQGERTRVSALRTTALPTSSEA